jgi:hypothetical protein
VYKTYGGVKASLHIALILTLDEGEWSASRLSRFTSGNDPGGNIKQAISSQRPSGKEEDCIGSRNP